MSGKSKQLLISKDSRFVVLSCASIDFWLNDFVLKIILTSHHNSRIKIGFYPPSNLFKRLFCLKCLSGLSWALKNKVYPNCTAGRLLICIKQNGYPKIQLKIHNSGGPQYLPYIPGPYEKDIKIFPRTSPFRKNRFQKKMLILTTSFA